MTDWPEADVLPKRRHSSSSPQPHEHGTQARPTRSHPPSANPVSGDKSNDEDVAMQAQELALESRLPRKRHIERHAEYGSGERGTRGLKRRRTDHP